MVTRGLVQGVLESARDGGSRLSHVQSEVPVANLGAGVWGPWQARPRAQGLRWPSLCGRSPSVQGCPYWFAGSRGQAEAVLPAMSGAWSSQGS